MEVTRSQRVESFLVKGLEALGRGEDALLAGLSGAHQEIGASYSVWMAPSAFGGGYAVCDPERSHRYADLPVKFPSSWTAEEFRGPLRLSGPQRMGRDPKAKALGVAWALVIRSAEAGSRAWFASPTPLQVSKAWTHSVVRALELLEQLEAERRRKETLERLAFMGEQTANITHDLRNQLSLTRLEFEAAASDPDGSLERADQALSQAFELCAEFMSASLPVQRSARPLAPHLIRQIEGAVQISGREGEVRVVQRCPKDLCAVFDDRLLDRYLRNLLLNGIAATPCGGAVRVEARQAPEGRVELIVTDAGKGMERVELQRLLHAGETLGGTGFGTSSILDCAEKMQADLDVESKPGAGTRICLSLSAT